MARILVIDDEESIRNTLQEILEYEKYSVDLSEDGEQGLELVKKNDYNVILCDIKMPKMDGIDVLERVTRLQPDTPVIMISGHGNIDTAVESIKKGAYDFIEKPLDLNRLLITIKNAQDKSTLVEETKRLKQKVSKNFQMVGSSASLTQVRQMVERVGPTEARVLITGENGTGKELVARQLHEMSQRKSSSFIEVNCAAIPSELIESELFGHEKGAFTSANKQRKGKFEQANGGTLFLDEIGDMSLSAQSKVLRALQENKITRVGGDKDIDVNVRIVAATNKNMDKEIEANRFREDLYHRISVILINVPPLRERIEDIPELASFFTEQICDEYKIKPVKITEDAIEELQKLQWTGNIREFRNVIERLIILSNEQITGKDVKSFAHPLSTTKKQ
ncbi:sigma-54-dependent transcriptional regulator [Salinivirga cyanobacteriivorans]|uniref:Transcriptional regulatory protein ZraR n=1 Tax=Salinivirga cyanobacteriivorans TaxID=1307839 RepID=A0A0S2HWA1_9BACT|nr:sigma-54 dependent transcriptional regulator [Salinivirga cyanobacteriivorans]ALO14334.1 Transcriptional regulatory protein ZraR [Salinivirga cyanobacteriivorans]